MKVTREIEIKTRKKELDKMDYNNKRKRNNLQLRSNHKKQS